jgi:2-iminoacetate synthase ThiH
MSALVDRAIRESSLEDVLGARRAGALTPEQIERLRSSDLLVLGALADRVRAEEVGDVVRIYTDEALEVAADVTVLPGPGSETTGLELLREVAMARIAGPRRASVRVDWTRCGLELAQIAMGFGANELVGRIANKRGLPLAEGEKLGVGKKSRLEAADVVKRKELEGFVRRAGRTPSFLPLVQETP